MTVHQQYSENINIFTLSYSVTQQLFYLNTDLHEQVLTIKRLVLLLAIILIVISVIFQHSFSDTAKTKLKLRQS